MLSSWQHWSLSPTSAPRPSKAGQGGGEIVLALLAPLEDPNHKRSCSQPAPPVSRFLKTFLDQLGRTAMLFPKSFIRVSLSPPSWFAWSVVSPDVGIQFCVGTHIPLLWDGRHTDTHSSISHLPGGLRNKASGSGHTMSMRSTKTALCWPKHDDRGDWQHHHDDVLFHSNPITKTRKGHVKSVSEYQRTALP